jgi:hypothetical protein
LAFAGLISIGGGSWRVRAATNRYVATTGNDTANDCSSPASPCATIQHAVTQAASGDTIHVAAGTYHENVIAFPLEGMTIQGAGAGATTVDGGNAGPVFAIGLASLTLSDLTITNGNGNNPIVDGSEAGGGITIAAQSAATVIRCTITGNTATQGASSGRGGGIFSEGTLTVMDSTITNNSADTTGGGIFIAGSTAVSTATITRCTVSGNTAGISGSGIYNNQGTLSLTDSTISGNNAQNFGGGIYNNKGTLSLARTTVSGNSAATGFGGGIYNNKGPTVSLTNSTISGNMANQGRGGGMENNGSTVTIANTTVSGNSAAANSGGGIDGIGTTFNLTNTIISGSTGGDCALNQGATLATNSHNLIQDGNCSPMLTGDPKLGPLQNNGGLTATRALLAGSPAIDAGDDSVTGSPLSLATDQRGNGFLRKAGLHVDIGAFEVQQAGGNSFDTCIKDTNTGNLFQFSSITGAYSFTICGQPAVTGTGKVQIIGSTIYLTDFTTPGRKIQAYFNHGQLTGRATVTLSVAPGVYQSTIVNQAMPSNGSCACQ